MKSTAINKSATIYSLNDPRTGAMRYIGKTTQDPRKRFSHHCSPSSFVSGQMRRWITELSDLDLNPQLTILEVCHPSLVNAREIHHIADYRSRGLDLLNVTSGGNGASPEHFTVEIRAAMSKAQSEVQNRPGARERGSARRSKYLDEHPELLRPVTAAPIRGGESINFPSLHSAARALRSTATNVQRSIKHGLACAGHLIAYTSDSDAVAKIQATAPTYTPGQHPNSKAVMCMPIGGGAVVTYGSQMDAARAMGVHVVAISTAIKRSGESAGHAWADADDPSSIERMRSFALNPPVRGAKKRRPVYATPVGGGVTQSFSSGVEASCVTGATRGNISRAISTGKSSAGYLWSKSPP